PSWCARASRSGCSSPPEREVDSHSGRVVGSYPSALGSHIPGSGRRFCSQSCGKCQSPCKDRPSARRRATNCRRSSITEHSFHGIHSFLPKRGKSVTYVSGTICHLCVGSLTLIAKHLLSPSVLQSLVLGAHCARMRLLPCRCAHWSRHPIVRRYRCFFVPERVSVKGGISVEHSARLFDRLLQ